MLTYIENSFIGSVGGEYSNLKSLQFNLAAIEAATNKFSNKNRIGKGGFGEVYKVINMLKNSMTYDLFVHLLNCI